VLIILFVRGLMLDGHKEGIEFYITPNMTKLQDSVVSISVSNDMFEYLYEFPL